MQEDKSWFDEYHDYEDTVKWYKRLAEAHPTLMMFIPSIGKTLQDRDMPCVHFTGNKTNLQRGKKKFYMQCQIHAREWISGATCMYLVQHFVKNYGKIDQITELMDNLEMILVPFVNPDGYVYTWGGDRMWRKNRNQVVDGECRSDGVDINRNFPTGFKHKENCRAEDYGGPYPISELETQHIISNFRRNSPIIGSIDFHSYGQLILRPWGMANISIPDERFYRTMTNDMVWAIKNVHDVTYTSEHSYDLYYCYGIAADWFYSDNAAATNEGYRSASLCIELRDKGDMTGDDGYGFLLPANQIIPTAEEVLPGVIVYMTAVMNSPLTFDNLISTDINRLRGQGRGLFNRHT